MGEKDETEAREGELDGELSAFLEARRDADHRLARRYGRLARAAYGAGLFALACTLVLWVVGAVASSDALFRVLLVAAAVFLVCGVLLAKLADLALNRRRSPPHRGSAGPPS